MTVTDYDVRSLYLDLLRRNLTRYGMHERMPSEWPLRRRVLFKAVNTAALRPQRHGPAQSRVGLGLAGGGRDDDRNAATHESAALR